MKTNILGQLKKKTTKRIIIGIFIVLGLIILTEVLLRCIWGFGTMPLYVESDKYEYMYAPNQEMVRFGNYFYTNSYCQRSQEPDSTRCIVLGIGDSVINGGSPTDNDSLATNIVSRETDFQMLNISAGAWSTENCAAYIREWGTFNAKAIFALVSGGNACEVMDFAPTVGIHRSFPNKQYCCAISEVINRYLIPRLFNLVDEQEQTIERKKKKFSKGWDELKSIADNADIPLIIILHANIFEIRNKEYNYLGDTIEKWAAENNIRLIKDITYLNEKDYRDKIHINNSGQRVIAELIKQELDLLFN